jgi:hypothetical protein
MFDLDQFIADSWPPPSVTAPLPAEAALIALRFSLPEHTTSIFGL